MKIAPFDREAFEAVPLVGILRRVPMEVLDPLTHAVILGGLTTLEITMNSPGAADQIRRASQISAGKLNIGAGTVTSEALLLEAVEAGASFIVTPTVNARVIARCVELDIPIFPGACSPCEIEAAWSLGAGMIKIFPAETLGPSFLRSLKGPLPHIPLMPTGGVDPDTIPGWIQAGANALGAGSPLFHPDRILAGDWDWIADRCNCFRRALEQARR